MLTYLASPSKYQAVSYKRLPDYEYSLKRTAAIKVTIFLHEP